MEVACGADALPRLVPGDSRSDRDEGGNRRLMVIFEVLVRVALYCRASATSFGVRKRIGCEVASFGVIWGGCNG